jgi:triacylglycerol lipase
MLPVLLHHGILGSDRVKIGPIGWSYFGGGIEQAIAARGHPVICTRVSPTGSIAVRAEELRQTLLDRLERLARDGQRHERVIIFAHSMGGLDARYMISKLDMADRVAALVTLSTPHRGSSYADWILRNIDHRPGRQILKLLGIGLDGARDLTLEAMARFNDAVLDHPAVRYCSISAARPWHRVPPFFMHSHRVVTQLEGANDGIVSVRSAIWGEHLETWPADHLHVVNRRLVVELREPTGSVLPRYARLLDHLTRPPDPTLLSASSAPTVS